MREDDYDYCAPVPLWLILLVVLAIAAVGATMARANPSSINVFLGRGATPVSFRAKTTGNSTAVTIPAGVAVGDIGVVYIREARNSPTLASGGGAWNSIFINGGGTSCGGSNCTTRVLWKVLVLADLSGSWTLSGSAPYTALDYIGNGATTLALRETEADYSASSVSFTGYTPVLSTRGALSIFSGVAGSSPTQPAGWTLRDSTVGSGPYSSANAADRLGYVSGALTWSTLNPVGGGYGGLLEFSGP